MVEWYQLHLGHPSFRPGLGRTQQRNSDKITSHGNKEIEISVDQNIILKLRKKLLYLLTAALCGDIVLVLLLWVWIIMHLN